MMQIDDTVLLYIKAICLRRALGTKISTLSLLCAEALLFSHESLLTSKEFLLD
jgi:hypothetical protein